MTLAEVRVFRAAGLPVSLREVIDWRQRLEPCADPELRATQEFFADELVRTYWRDAAAGRIPVTEANHE